MNKSRKEQIGTNNIMKKILSLLIFVLSAVNISAQEVVHYKQSEDKTYFRVSVPGKKDKYYSTKNTNDGKVNPHIDFNKDYSYKWYYNKLDVQEKLMDMTVNAINEKGTGFHFANDIQKDSKDIVAKVVKRVKSSSKLEVGCFYKLFAVTEATDKSLVGCDVVCQVIERRKSNLSGAEGRLVIRPIYVEKQDGTQIRLQPTDIQRRGLNRSNVKTWTSFLIIPAFIAGSKAEINTEEYINLRLE